MCLPYTLTCTNSSRTAQETNVVITDKLPDLVDYIEGSITGAGRYDPDSRTLRWSIATVWAGQSSSVGYQARIAKGSTGQIISNDARITGDNTLPKVSNTVFTTIGQPKV
ncbi:MAG: hypothetical protein QME81_07030 [bacterium]|nr:hypothetical protein [bacterium]